MKYAQKFILSLLLTTFASVGGFPPSAVVAGVKGGAFMNPITDVAWQEVFPIKIAGITLISASGFDVPDMANFPICACPLPPPIFFRIGIPISFWEPARLIETVSTPFYFPFIGMGVGSELANKGFLQGSNSNITAGAISGQDTNSQAHYFIFPVWGILELLTDLVCLETSGFDLAYLTEIDPLWQEDELAFLIQPEALLFANPAAQMACVADSVLVNAWAPLDALFWCVGSGGSSYPMTGHVNDSKIIQANYTIASRMIYKLAREFLLCDTNITLCGCFPTPIWIKSNYKLQAVRPMVSRLAWPIGKSQFFYGTGLNPPIQGALGPSGEFLWLMFRKRSCCMF